MDRVLLLETQVTVPLSDDSAKGYEELDSIIKRCMIRVEKMQETIHGRSFLFTQTRHSPESD